MIGTRSTYQRRLAFEIRLAEADDALRALEAAMRADTEDAVIVEAFQARRVIRAAYRAWHRLDRWERHRGALVDMRRHGHLLLSEYLCTPRLARPTISERDGLEYATTMALLAMLWKVVNALDEIPDADVT